MSTSFWEKATFWANISVAAITLGAVVAAYSALTEYRKTNRAEARAQLYGAERSIAKMEITDAELRRIYAEVAPNTRPEEFVRQLMAIALYGKPQAPLPQALATANSAQLYTFIWGAESYAAPEAEILRKLYIHCEAYLYHVHNVFDLTKEERIERGEWETWRRLLGEIGPNPICLSAVYSAEKKTFFSRAFAKEFQDAMQHDPMHKAVVGLVYPQLLLDTWPEKFPKF